ncbi:uncharacterized protein [Amphiura filiformis]|uniref:uncharacterized protein n=1 Tax=Amphiura filiformis TaxID=82378 RepID=UPI003B213040
MAWSFEFPDWTKYVDVNVKNETEKSWAVTLFFNRQKSRKHKCITQTIKPGSSYPFRDIYKPNTFRVQFASSGDSIQKNYSCGEWKNSRRITVRIRRLDRKSAELYQDGKGRLFTIYHPDPEGDEAEEKARLKLKEEQGEKTRQEQEEKTRQEQLKKEQQEKARQEQLQKEQEEKSRQEQLKKQEELTKQIQKEKDEKKRRLLEIENTLERQIHLEVPVREQHQKAEILKCPTSLVKDDEETCTGIYDEIVASQPAYKEFEESKSLHIYAISDRSGYLVNFILADYCNANNSSPSFHEEVLSVTAYNEARLSEKLTILDALSKSVHRFSMFDELENLEDSIGVHNLDARIDLFLRLLCVTTHSNVELATNILVHCLKILHSVYGRSSCKLTTKEKEHLSLLISNRIWSPTSALKLLSCIDGRVRSDVLHKSLIHHIQDKSLLQEQVCLSSPSCTSRDVGKLVDLVQKRIALNQRRKEVRTGATDLPECRNELTYDDFVELLVALLEKIRSHQKQSLTEVMNENQLRLLIEALICKSISNESLTSVNREEKSTVVAMVAAIRALLGYAVDIVVRSETYVANDVKKWQEFYSSLELFSCAVSAKNIRSNSVPTNIVYCTPSQFKDIERIARPGGLFTCFIIYDSPPTRSQDKDIDYWQFSHLLPKYQLHSDLRNGTNSNEEDQTSLSSSSYRQEHDMKDIMVDIDRIIYREKDKSFHQLLEEIEASAAMSPELHTRMVEVIVEIEKKIEERTYTQSDIQTVKRHVQNLDSASEMANAVVALVGHVQKHTKFIPRNNQILAVVTLLLEQNQGMGCLLEVATGEGKSTIVAMFAAIQALRGKFVDVVTSSELLARRDEEEWRPFYKDLGLTSCAIPVPETLSCNTQEEVDSLLREKYQSKIVYGTTSEFAADILRHEFERRNIRGNREFQVVIVDEVDSMTLDNGLQLTYLSHNTTSLRHIEQLLATIWCHLSSHHQIQDSSGNILWATKPQYIHTTIAENIVEQSDDLMEKSCDILQEGITIGLIKEESECGDIRKMYTQGQTEELQDKIQSIMANITTEHEIQLIKSQNVDHISFQYFVLGANNIAMLKGVEDVSYDERNRVSLLLLDKGLSSELYTEQDLKKYAIEVVGQKIRYSDDLTRIEELLNIENIALPKYHKEHFEKTQMQESTDIVLPMYLRKYVEECLPIFVENALRALSMTLGREYVVVEGRDSLPQNEQQDHAFDRVIPVDFEGTGILEKNKKWADGLQQFLEMKHQLAISPVSTVTNFMSNYRFFRRYLDTCGIHGVTGTLGDNIDHFFLKEHFLTKCLSLPTHRRKKLVCHPMMRIDRGRESWIRAVCDRVNKVARGQAVLVVCEDLKTAENFETKINSLEDSNVREVHMYTRSDIHKYDIERREYMSGEVIITTTLGGRGTDYKVHNSVHSRGGLFVLLTFFPKNMRVEKQMLGRTARKGEPGMVQLILDQKSLPEAYQGHSMEMMHILRSKYEQEQIQRLETNELISINRREELFETFCRKLKNFESRYSSDEKDPHKMLRIPAQSKFDYSPGLNSVKERWAFWLTLHRSKIEDNEIKLSDLQYEMECDIQTKIDETQIGKSDNFYDHACNAKSRMILLDAEHDFGVLQRWQTLIDTEKWYNAVAFYNQAYVTIKVKKQGYIEKSLDLLEKTLTGIKAYTAEMANVTSCIQAAASVGHSRSHLGSQEGQTNFSRQQTARGSFIKAWIEATERAKEVLKGDSNDEFTYSVEPVGLNFAVHVDESDDAMKEEMMQMLDMGMTYFFKVEKKRKFKFSLNALWCFLLGALQVVAGTLALAFTLGAASSIGVGLISEGIADMIEGTIGMVTGSFSWAEWAISKAISLATSLVCCGLGALKKVAKVAWKGVKAAVGGIKGTATKSATQQTLKSNFKIATKYVVQEIGQQGVMTGTSLLWDKACTKILEGIFKEHFRDIITQNLNSSKQLHEMLSVFIKETMPTNSSESDKDQLNDVVKRTCDKTLSKILNTFQGFDEITSQIDRWKGLLSTIASKKRSTTAKALCTTIEITQYTRLVTELVQTWPTTAYIKDNVASALSQDMNTLLNFKNAAQQTSPHSDLHYRLFKSVCETVTDRFTEKITHLLVSISQRHACKYVSGKLGTVTANALGRADVNQQLIDQKHSWEMKVDSDGIKRANTSLSQEEVSHVYKLASEAADPSKPASDLHLNVLVHSGLIEGGRGIIIDIVDENRKHVTSKTFDGKPGSEPIRLRLVQTKEGERSSRQKCSGKVNSYIGHFQRLDKRGNIVQEYGPIRGRDNQNCLFDAITHGTGKKPDELRQIVAEKIRTEPGKWKEAALRQHQFDFAYKNSSLFSSRGGVSVEKTFPEVSRIREIYKQSYNQNGGSLKKLSKEEQQLQLGTVDEYNSRINDPQQKHNPATQQDHIPPKRCLTRSGEMPGQGLAMTVRTEHHRAALSTGSSKESQLARKYVTELREKGMEVDARYASYVIAHPGLSNMIREKTGLKEHVQDIGHHSTEYYTEGFLNHAAAKQAMQTDDSGLKNDVAFIRSLESPNANTNTTIRGLIDFIDKNI